MKLDVFLNKIHSELSEVHQNIEIKFCIYRDDRRNAEIVVFINNNSDNFTIWFDLTKPNFYKKLISDAKKKLAERINKRITKSIQLEI